MAVKMYKSDSTLRMEDESVEKPAVKMQDVTLHAPTNKVPAPVRANFVEQVNQGLAIGGNNINTTPSTMDSMGANQLTKEDIEKILNDI